MSKELEELEGIESGIDRVSKYAQALGILEGIGFMLMLIVLLMILFAVCGGWIIWPGGWQ